MTDPVTAAGQYPVERVVSGEAFHDVVVEVTPLGADAPKWVHRVRSLVLTDDAGEPDYLVLILHDDTERFAAEERFESSFNVNPAPAVICRQSDQLFIKVNRGFLELTGFRRDDVIAHGLTEIDILAGVENKDHALERIIHNEPVQQSEARRSRLSTQQFGQYKSNGFQIMLCCTVEELH